jgi:hypothetical protein
VTQESPKLRRAKATVLGVVIGAVFALAIVFGGQRLFGPGPIPVLDPNVFESQRERWQTQRLQNYDLETTVEGRQAAVYRVEVRSGKVVSAKRNERDLPPGRTWETWSIDGMFRTIATDVESLRKHAAGTADQSTPDVALRAEFDSDLGYPKRFLRVQRMGQAPSMEVTWKVTEFTKH